MLERVRDKIRMMINGGNGGRGRPSKETMLIIFLSGILIFVILLPTGNTNSSYAAKKSQKNVEYPNHVEDTLDSLEDGKKEAFIEDYKRRLEQELEDFLSSVAGVGTVKVLIYIKESSEYVVEKDSPTSNSVNGENSEVRKEETTVYTVNGNGDQVPFIAQTKSPQIDGVVISAQGASNEAVRLQIVKLVMALYGVEANKIEVLEMGQTMQN
ncbi:hypothetical protein IMSAGC011_01577 [Lachnospiraceae bacterium]|nr:hypothetical protein IMSAGC011_01577 [Lachnospiraceae bacterium]